MNTGIRAEAPLFFQPLTSIDGEWATTTGVSFFKIIVKGRRLWVVDASRGTLQQVNTVAWQGRSVAFDTRNIHSGVMVRVRATFMSSKMASVAFQTEELLKRLAVRPCRSSLKAALLGKWISFDGSSDVEFELKYAGVKLQISAKDREDGECLEVYFTRYYSGGVRFSTFSKQGGCWRVHHFRLISHDIIVNNIQWDEEWVRAD